LLLNGNVLAAGGIKLGVFLSSAELYDSTIGTWSTISSMTNARYNHTATLLPNERVLIAGGTEGTTPGAFASLSNCEVYVVGQGFSNSWQPHITAVTSPLNLGGPLEISGAGFRGLSEGSSGNVQSSAADYPLVQLRSIESGQSTFLLSTNWSANSFTSLPVWNFPPGYALATVFVNGIPSTSSVINISVPVPTTTLLTDATRLTNGLFQFAFTNSPGALFGVLAATNPALPLSNWAVLGVVAESSPGQFQFSDLQATNLAQRFYIIRVP
jgi:hypothetical protein